MVQNPFQNHHKEGLLPNKMNFERIFEELSEQLYETLKFRRKFSFANPAVPV